MARIGSNIQAGLGRIDYSPLFQGMSNAQQFAAQGNAALAQSISNLGQIAASAIQGFQQKKEEEKRIGQTIDFLRGVHKANPQAFKIFANEKGEFDEERARVGVNAVGAPGIMQYATFTNEAAKEAKDAQTRQQASTIAELYRQGGGKLPSPINKNVFTPEALSAGYKDFLATAGAEAGIGKTRAEIAALGRTNPQDFSFQEQQVQAKVAAFEQANGRAPNAQERAKILDEVAKAGAATTNIDLGQKGAERLEIFKTLRAERDQIAPIARLSSTAETLQNLLSNKDLITGKTANAELALKAFAQDLGIADFPEVANTQTYISLIGQAVALQIKNFGAGTALSDADRRFAERMAGGDVTMTAESLQRLQNILNKASRETLNEYNARINDSFSPDDPFYKTLIFNERAAPFFLSKKTTPAAPIPTRERTFDGSRFGSSSP